MRRAELGNLRLEVAYRDIQKFTGQKYIEWLATKGTEPYYEEYLLTIKVRTYYDKEKTMDSCQVRVTFPSNFPQQPPDVNMVSRPLVFHPHWWPKGVYCPGTWWVGETFENYIKRMIMTLQNDPSMVNEKGVSAANSTAMEWYWANRDNKQLFPSDHQEITTKRPTKRRFVKISG